MDKFKKMFCCNRKIMVFLFGIFILSIIFGSILPLFLNSSDKKMITDYLSNFVSNIHNYNFSSLLFNGFFSNFGFLIIIFILGISIIGVFAVVFLFFLKGFILGFSISSIIINYGIKGLLFGFVYLFPHQIINMFIYCALTCYSISFSVRFIMFLFKKYDFNIRLFFRKYLKFFCISSCFILVCSLYESFLWPKLLIFIFDLLGL